MMAHTASSDVDVGTRTRRVDEGITPGTAATTDGTGTVPVACSPWGRGAIVPSPPGLGIGTPARTGASAGAGAGAGAGASTMQ